METSDGFLAGGAYVFSRSEDSWVQVVTLTEVEGVRARFEPALEKEMEAGSRLDSIARRKLSPSVAWRGAAGWAGIFTGYGAVPGRLLEYTFWVRADSASAFSFLTERASPAFPAERSELRHSTENPEPLREDASCSPSEAWGELPGVEP